MDEIGVPNTIFIDRAILDPSYNINADESDERDAIGGYRAIVGNEYQAQEGEFTGSARCDTDDIITNLAPVAGKNIDVYEPRESKDADVENEEVEIRDNDGERIVGQKQRNDKTHYIVRWY